MHSTAPTTKIKLTTSSASAAAVLFAAVLLCDHVTLLCTLCDGCTRRADDLSPLDDLGIAGRSVWAINMSPGGSRMTCIMI